MYERLKLVAPCSILSIVLICGCGADQSDPATSVGEEVAGQYINLHRDPHQDAFSLLVPRGWTTEGGAVPSGVPWNVVDLVENNIMFRATSEDGKSFFGWYPRFYFQDPAVFARNSFGMMRVPTGHVMNGCWVYPYMGIEDFVRTIVFGLFAKDELVTPRILGAAIDAPELRAFLPQAATRSQCGYVNFECLHKGEPSYGRMYTILYDLGGQVWSYVGAFGFVAPKSRWVEDERLMERCIRTFRLNPEWVALASKAAAKRGDEYYKTIRGINESYNEMQKQMSQSRSDRQLEVHKVLVGEMETADPQTGKETWLPMYNEAWSDGEGNYFVSDEGVPKAIANNPDWRQLKIINRNER